MWNVNNESGLAKLVLLYADTIYSSTLKNF